MSPSERPYSEMSTHVDQYRTSYEHEGFGIGFQISPNDRRSNLNRKRGACFPDFRTSVDFVGTLRVDAIRLK